MAFKRKKSNPLRILPTNVPQTYWVACRTPETEMDEFVPKSCKGLIDYNTKIMQPHILYSKLGDLIG